MTRKDYELIASVIRKEYTPYMKEHYKYAFESIRVGLADTLAADNPRFNRERFLSACQS